MTGKWWNFGEHTGETSHPASKEEKQAKEQQQRHKFEDMKLEDQLAALNLEVGRLNNLVGGIMAERDNFAIQNQQLRLQIDNFRSDNEQLRSQVGSLMARLAYMR